MVEVFPFEEEVAHFSALIRVNLERKGTPIGACDVLIAGAALAKKGVLVTSNTKDLSRVSKLEIEDWHK